MFWSFADGDDGAYPQGKPLLGAGGVVYGTASWGGEGCERNGCGDAFMLTPTRNGYYRFAILHQFTAGLDGADPEGSGLVADSSGNLYGTTRSGGGRRCSDGGPGGVRGCGVLYELGGPVEGNIYSRFWRPRSSAYDDVLAMRRLLVGAVKLEQLGYRRVWNTNGWNVRRKRGFILRPGRVHWIARSSIDSSSMLFDPISLEGPLSMGLHHID